MVEFEQFEKKMLISIRHNDGVRLRRLLHNEASVILWNRELQNILQYITKPLSFGKIITAIITAEDVNADRLLDIVISCKPFFTLAMIDLYGFNPSCIIELLQPNYFSFIYKILSELISSRNVSNATKSLFYKVFQTVLSQRSKLQEVFLSVDEHEQFVTNIVSCCQQHRIWWPILQLMELLENNCNWFYRLRTKKIVIDLKKDEWLCNLIQPFAKQKHPDIKEKIDEAIAYQQEKYNVLSNELQLQQVPKDVIQHVLANYI